MSDMTIGGDVPWKMFKEIRARCTCVMVMGEVYPETDEDMIEMAGRSMFLRNA